MKKGNTPLFPPPPCTDDFKCPNRAGPFLNHSNPPGSSYPAVNFAKIRDGLGNTIFVGEVRGRCSEYARNGWADTRSGGGFVGTTIPINYMSCNQPGTPNADPLSISTHPCTSLGFKSAHPGGAIFLLGDGSVRFVGEGLDQDLYQKLGAIADGLPTPGDY